MIKQRKPEAFSNARILTQLSNLGWIFDGDDRNVYLEGECKTEEQKKKLNGLRPDFILYKKGGMEPLGIIESKKQGENLEAGLKQGQAYAKLLGVNAVFATDSYVVKSSTADGNDLTIDSLKIQDIVGEGLLLKLARSANVTTSNKVIKSREELIKLFKSAEQLLRKDGIDVGMPCVYEFCVILFIKIQSEVNQEKSWEELSASSKKDIIDIYTKILGRYKSTYPGIFRESNIKNSEVLLHIVHSLQGINLSDTDIDIKGEAYEYFLKRYSKQNKSVLGQHFTPRHITNMMSLLLDPVVGETIYDPFCGTGGMLISCYKWMRKNITDHNEIEILNKDSLYGRDINYGTSQLAKMNMVLIEDGNSNIEQCDSLNDPVNRKYDKVITNIPFNLREKAPGHLYKSSYSNANAVCVLHCLDAVKIGGRACIIVPENICYNPKYKDFRRDILSRGTISCVIRLPRSTFKSYTTARTCILLFNDIGKKKTKEFKYVDIIDDGFSHSTWREPIRENDIPTLLEYKDNLEHYPTIPVDKNFLLVPPTQDPYSGYEYCLLGDVIDVKITALNIDPLENYYEPKICSHTNTIRKRGEARLGRNIKGKGKVLIEPGDLVIGTLHTQSGNGLFAVSEEPFLATSQIVAKINETKIDKDYLVYMLKKLLPKLSTDDLVGRETYTREKILNIKIPIQPDFFAKPEYKKLKLEIERLEKQMGENFERETSHIKINV